MYFTKGDFHSILADFRRFLEHTVQVAGQKGNRKILMAGAKDILEQERPSSLLSYRTKSSILGWASVPLRHPKVLPASGTLLSSSWLRTDT